MDISVIVPAHDAEATLGRTLDALAAQDLEGDFEVIVVDDGSNDATAEVADASSASVIAVERPGRGQAEARNLAAARARGAALAFCDADVFPTPGWLAAGRRALEEADVVQGRVLPDPEASLGPFDRTIWVNPPGGLWEAANLFISRELFERLGGFTAGVGPRGGKALGEDVLLGYRARRLGARGAFCADALSYHAVFPRSWREYVAERRRLEFFPLLAREAPELRECFFHRRLFLSWRSARLDLALAGAGASAALDRPWPLLAALPYLKLLCSQAGRAGPGGPHVSAVVAADLAADLVGLASLALGSLRYRTLLV